MRPTTVVSSAYFRMWLLLTLGMAIVANQGEQQEAWDAAIRGADGQWDNTGGVDADSDRLWSAESLAPG